VNNWLWSVGHFTNSGQNPKLVTWFGAAGYAPYCSGPHDPESFVGASNRAEALDQHSDSELVRKASRELAKRSTALRTAERVLLSRHLCACGDNRTIARHCGPTGRGSLGRKDGGVASDAAIGAQ
jgi:hypothetical protein